MASRIEQIIEEIEEYIDGCRFQPLSTTKIVVNKEELEELLRELRLKTPDEIKRYQKIISNKDAILADAQEKADKIIANAEAKAQEMISQHEVTQQAYAQAQEIVEMASAQAQEILEKASEEAGAMRMAAVSYTDDNLGAIEDILAHGIDVAATNYERLMTQLQETIGVIQANRSQLYPVDDATQDNGDNEAGSIQQPEKEEGTGGVDLI